MDTNGLVTVTNATQACVESVEVNDAMRLALVDAVLKMLEADDDSRAPAAIENYRAQRERIVARIQASNPPAVTIQANVARLGARGN